MTPLDKIKRILKRWYGRKFTVYVGDTPFEVDVDKLRPGSGPLKLKDNPDPDEAMLAIRKLLDWIEQRDIAYMTRELELHEDDELNVGHKEAENDKG